MANQLNINLSPEQLKHTAQLPQNVMSLMPTGSNGNTSSSLPQDNDWVSQKYYQSGGLTYTETTRYGESKNLVAPVLTQQPDFSRVEQPAVPVAAKSSPTSEDFISQKHYQAGGLKITETLRKKT